MSSVCFPKGLESCWLERMQGLHRAVLQPFLPVKRAVTLPPRPLPYGFTVLAAGLGPFLWHSVPYPLTEDVGIDPKV